MEFKIYVRQFLQSKNEDNKYEFNIGLFTSRVKFNGNSMLDMNEQHHYRLL